MNIKIVDSWLREFLDTKATPKEIAIGLSLTSVSVEQTEKVGDDTVYDIEVTTNRPDLMSIIGIAKEASAALSEQGIPARFVEPKTSNIQTPALPAGRSNIPFPIEIKNDPKLVNRICAVVMEVEIGKSPKEVKDRLEKSGIRSLNNLIDVTNCVMREIGHPCHVFDFDFLAGKKMIIRESKPNEIITTLDGKQYRLYGGDIVADDGSGEIIDLLGVMGTANSVVKESTKRILLFLDNNNPANIRKTSMSLGIRTEAAIINEKGIDPELVIPSLRRGVELYQKIAKGKVIYEVFDTYPNRPKARVIKVPNDKVNKVLGVEIAPNKSKEILGKLGFEVRIENKYLEVGVPTIRSNEVLIDEDIIEEIARIYGYHKLPSIIPSFLNNKNVPYASDFYFEERVKNALKYWGYDEVYSYSLIPEDLYDGPIDNALKLKNPLSSDMVYLRNSLVPSLLQVIENNKSREEIKIFELSNVYHKREGDLPSETLMLGGVVKKDDVSFFEIKGLIEQILEDLGTVNYKFKNRKEGPGANVFTEEKIGYIEILNNDLVDFELNFNSILKHANMKKIYKPIAKFPPVVEDLTLVINKEVSTEEIIDEIKKQSSLISEVTLKDQFESSRTFHIIYQAIDRNLTNEEVSRIRKKLVEKLVEKFKAQVK